MPNLRPTRRSITALLVISAAALVPATAAEGQRSKGDSINSSKLLWATVNVCDTKDHPDTVGIRGSMPGSGISDEQMFMRFQLQYFDTKDDRWHNLTKGGDFGFVPVGSARFRARQTGRNFTVRPPARGAFILRGAVTFEWRRDGEVVRRARKRTRSGQGNTKGADPKGFSASKCEVRP